MAQHEHIIFLIMILRTWWSGWEIMCEKWVEFPYFPYFNKNDMQIGDAPNEFIGLNIMIYYFLFDI